MRKPGQVCGTCMHFNVDEQSCHARAPNPLLVIELSPPGRDVNPARTPPHQHAITFWPHTTEDQWCGSWQRARPNP